MESKLSAAIDRALKRPTRKAFRVFHWDTFDNETLLLTEVDTLEAADAFVQHRYAGRISPNGADRVDIVDRNGNVVCAYSVK